MDSKEIQLKNIEALLDSFKEQAAFYIDTTFPLKGEIESKLDGPLSRMLGYEGVSDDFAKNRNAEAHAVLDKLAETVVHFHRQRLAEGPESEAAGQARRMVQAAREKAAEQLEASGVESCLAAMAELSANPRYWNVGAGNLLDSEMIESIAKATVNRLSGNSRPR
jgi:hypothetical protein